MMGLGWIWRLTGREMDGIGVQTSGLVKSGRRVVGCVNATKPRLIHLEEMSRGSDH